MHFHYKKMGRGSDKEYPHDSQKEKLYDKLYAKYTKVGLFIEPELT